MPKEILDGIVAEVNKAILDLEAQWVQSVLDLYIPLWLTQAVADEKHPQFLFYIGMIQDYMREHNLKVERNIKQVGETLVHDVSISHHGALVAKNQFQISAVIGSK